MAALRGAPARVAVGRRVEAIALEDGDVLNVVGEDASCDEPGNPGSDDDGVTGCESDGVEHGLSLLEFRCPWDQRRLIRERIEPLCAAQERAGRPPWAIEIL
ncbi:hypothetical protein WMF18_01235 [Sorangium sp. So ce315]|uniref:hypothetical protein n=1 Tax=Sorangium sp. So ce315 TaxID=3133299 RepID=UPI003F5E161B